MYILSVLSGAFLSVLSDVSRSGILISLYNLWFDDQSVVSVAHRILIFLIFLLGGLVHGVKLLGKLFRSFLIGREMKILGAVSGNTKKAINKLMIDDIKLIIQFHKMIILVTKV